MHSHVFIPRIALILVSLASLSINKSVLIKTAERLRRLNPPSLYAVLTFAEGFWESIRSSSSKKSDSHSRLYRPELLPVGESPNSPTRLALARVQLRRSARPKENLRASALMDWAVTEYPEISLEKVPVFIQNLLEMRRANLFLAFKEELYIDRGHNFGSFERIESRHEADNCSLVVAR